jgi:hypothetical protein
MAQLGTQDQPFLGFLGWHLFDSKDLFDSLFPYLHPRHPRKPRFLLWLRLRRARKLHKSETQAESSRLQESPAGRFHATIQYTERVARAF